METIGIRVEVPPVLHVKLLHEQDKLKSLARHKPTLSELMKKLTELGFKYQEEMETRAATGQHSKRNDIIPDQIKNNILSAKERELQAKEKELKSWETNLRSREYEIIEKSKTINESSDALMEQRNDIYDQKEKLMEKSQETLMLKTHKENLEKTFEAKNEEIMHLQHELKEMKQNIYKIVENIDKKTETTTFMKFVMPLLPVIAVIIGTIILNKKIQSSENLSLADKEILNAFNLLSSDEQDEIKKHISDLMFQHKKE